VFQHGTAFRDAIVGAPLLLLNPLPFLGRDLDEMLPTATGAIMATPVLKNRQAQSVLRHAKDSIKGWGSSKKKWSYNRFPGLNETSRKRQRV